MRPLRSLLIGAALAVIAAPAFAEEAWTHVQDKVFGFAIDMPCAAEAVGHGDDPARPTDRRYACRFEDGTMLGVAVADLDRTPADTPRSLDDLRDALKKELGADTVEPFTMGYDVKGYDMRGVHDGQAIDVRVMARGRIAFIITGVGPDGGAPAARYKRTRESFAFVQ